MGLYRQCFHPRFSSPGHGADFVSDTLPFVKISPPCFNVFLSGRNQPRYTFNQDQAAIPVAAKLNLCGGKASFLSVPTLFSYLFLNFSYKICEQKPINGHFFNIYVKIKNKFKIFAGSI